MHFVVMEITLVDAFNTWSSGEKVNEDAFIRILWFFSYKSLIWQRISKIIAFLSSCTIILDIIGEENLREYADKIDTSFRTIDIFIILKKIRQSKLNVFFIILIVNLFSFYWLYYLDKILKEVLKSYPQLSWFLLLSVISSCAGFFFMIFFMILKKDFFANISLILFFPFILFVLCISLPTIIFALLLFSSNYILLILSLIMKYTVLFIASVLSLNNFKNIISIVTFVFVILSFSLDLILS